MLRRNFIKAVAYGTAAWPCTAMGQQSVNKMWRVAYLYPGSLADPADHAVFDVFRAEMRALGYNEGKNLVIDDRSARGQA